MLPEQELVEALARIETLEAEVANIKTLSRAVVASAGNWIHEAQHSDDLIKLAAALEVSDA